MILNFCIDINNRYKESQKDFRNLITKITKDINVKYNVVIGDKYGFDYLTEYKDSNLYLWESSLIESNLSLVTEIPGIHVVVLDSPTILIRKSTNNIIINENLAANNGFYIYYINPSKIDDINKEYRLIIDDNVWLMTDERLKKLLIK